MKRLLLSLAVCGGIAAVAPAATSAQPPQPPLACAVVLTTPAPETGTPGAIANKFAAYTRVCGLQPPG